MSVEKECGQDLVFKYVVEQIVSRKILPGQLIYESAIAKATNLSRTPVREAFVRLVSGKFLEQAPGRKGYLFPKLTIADMQEVFHARECVESKIAFLAAANATKSDVDLLTSITTDELETKENRQKNHDCIYLRNGESYDNPTTNIKFHLTLSTLAKNKYLESIYEIIYWRSHLYTHYILMTIPLSSDIEIILKERRQNNAIAAEHAAIIKAISDRNCEMAAQCASKHIINTTTYKIAFNSTGLAGF